MRRAVAMTATATLLVAACSGTGPTGGASIEIDPALAGSLSEADAQDAAASANAFGFELHREVAEPGANTVTSPLSASVLLAMVAAGAGGETAEAMTQALGLDATDDPRFAALLAELADVDDVELAVANSLWANQGTPFEEDYLTFARETYGATLDEVPLGEQATADRIDDWVEERTEGLIEDMADDLGLPDPNAVLVLLNAVYFLGEWTEQFDPDDTREADFTLADGETVDVPTMHRDDDELELELSRQDDHQLVRLTYGEDERFGMEIVLPDESLDLDGFMADFDADQWQDSIDGLSPSRVGVLALPRFELEWDAELTDALIALGMGPAFDAGADFLPMSPSNPWLETVVQKTYLRVDEAGTEAAAATGGVMVESAPPELRIDRPFVFTVSDRETGAVLFLGTVHDPRG